MSATEFRFGLEAEYIVTEAASWTPLWHDGVSFETLNRCMERVELGDLPSMDGLRLEAPYRKRMPFVVEGYHLPEPGPHAVDILAKGAEIRTPVCRTLDETLSVFGTLFDRLQGSLAQEGLVAVALSRHPIAVRFDAPQGARPDCQWLWAKEAMATYGPDVNVSFPEAVASRLDLDELLLKINHYCPAMTALSVASPFFQGGLWSHEGRIGKSYRTFRRSEVAPPLEIHPHENGRIEFKTFEMSTRVEDFRNYFLLFLTLVLDDRLPGRSNTESRIRGLKAVALDGLSVDEACRRADALIESAYRTLPAWGFDPSTLKSLGERIATRRTPADDLIERYLETGSLEEVLRSRASLTREAGMERVPRVALVS